MKKIKKKSTTFKICPVLMERFRKVTKKAGISQASVIDSAIREETEYLERRFPEEEK